MFPSHIFKAYDIRGLVDGELSPELAYAVGNGFVFFLKEKHIDLAGKKLVVGYDMRQSSVPFAKAVIRGMTDAGIDAVDIGLTSTPVFNFACAHFAEHAGGIMVTASHNPAAYNGFKITLGNGLPVGGVSGLDVIRDFAEAGHALVAEQKGTVEERDVRDAYYEKIFSIVSPQAIRPMKIVIDAGNGMGQVTFPNWLPRLPMTVEYLYLQPDGTFPNHEANPLKTETLSDLQKKVIETGADFGFALDGDCDRIGLADEKGDIVDASAVGALVGLEVLQDHPNARMYYDLRQSMIVPEVWRAAGASLVEKTKVGHANIKKAMKENNIAFASELSMHLYFHSMYDLESSDLALLYVLRMLSRSENHLSELTAPLKKYFHSGEINFDVKEKALAIARVRDRYAKEAMDISELDGLWMGFDWGWLNVRASNTEPVLRLNLEARDEKTMREKVQEISHIIQL